MYYLLLQLKYYRFYSLILFCITYVFDQTLKEFNLYNIILFLFCCRYGIIFATI